MGFSKWFKQFATDPEFAAQFPGRNFTDPPVPQSDITAAAGVANGNPNVPETATVEPPRGEQAQPGNFQPGPEGPGNATGNPMTMAQMMPVAWSRKGLGGIGAGGRAALNGGAPGQVMRGAFGGLFGGGGPRKDPSQSVINQLRHPQASKVSSMAAMGPQAPQLGQGSPFGRSKGQLGGKVMMVAPTGEQQEVAEYLVPYYKAKGGRVVGGR